MLHPYERAVEFVVFDRELLSPDLTGRTCAPVLAIFRDGDQNWHAAFQYEADMPGVYVIALGSTFFHGFTEHYRENV